MCELSFNSSGITYMGSWIIKEENNKIDFKQEIKNKKVELAKLNKWLSSPNGFYACKKGDCFVIVEINHNKHCKNLSNDCIIKMGSIYDYEIIKKIINPTKL